jgi:23S rRNA pseudouridine955/2504/2580 synthase
VNKLEQFIIPESEDQSRLDRCLRRNLGEINQSLLEKSLRNKHILLNGKKAQASDKVEKNQIITYESSIFLKGKKVFSTISKNKKFFYLNLYKKSLVDENKNWVILNKPNKIAVQGGTGQNKNIDELLRSISNDSQFKLVHRLDKDTSGILVIAKNLKTAKIFHDFFKNKKIIKVYLAVIYPPPSKNEQYITSNIEKSSFSNKRKMTTSDIKGKFAKTYMKILVKNSKYALVLLCPITGRTHQLRVHMNYIGCSIIGDKKYKLIENFHDNENFLKLHSYCIKFPNEDFIKAPLPKHFVNFMKENKLDIDLEKIEKNFEKEFKYE